MKSYLLLIVLAFFHFFSFTQNRCKICVDGKFGFIDTVGNVKIQPKFDHVSQFSEGLAVFHLDSTKKGYIDIEGKVVIPQQFEYASQFTNGVAVVGNNEKYGLINKSGELIVDFSYDSISPALINKNRIGVKQNELWGYISPSGKIVIEIKYSSISKFHNGSSRVRINGLFGVIDTTGSYILPPIYQWINSDSFYDNRIAVETKGEDGVEIIDRQGNKISNTKFFNVSRFSDGQAFVIEGANDLGYYIDTNGNKSIQEVFINGGLFKYGRAVVTTDDGYAIIDTNGEIVFEPGKFQFSLYYQNGFITYFKKNKSGYRYGLMGINGEIITKLRYTSILTNDGDCMYPELYKNGKSSNDFNTSLGYSNKQGHLIWKPRK